MNKALQILSIPLFLFIVSCESDLPIGLQSTTDPNTIDGVMEANMVTQSNGDIIKDQYIVMFEEDIPYFERLDQETTIEESSLQRGTREANAEIIEKRATAIESYLENTLAEHKLDPNTVMSVYDMGRIKGGMVNITAADAIELGKDEQVAIIEPNEVIALGLTPGAKGRLIPADDGPAKQITPYNIEAIGGFKPHPNGKTWAFIIDSGIDMDHPELSVVAHYSKSFVPYETSPNDEFGHGTHVAGIIGAKNDGRGVVGVASSAPLVALKVLDKNGYGTKDYLLQALQYLKYACIPGDVVNISLGTGNSAIINSQIAYIQMRKRVHFTIASGNQGIDASNLSPANITSTHTYVVGSVDVSGSISVFSNFGTSVKYLAPGEGIYSTFINGQYAWLSGTSMAAPHMAGILLTGKGKHGTKHKKTLPSGNQAEVVKRK